MSSIGFATLSIVPVVRGIGSGIESQLSGPLGNAGRAAGAHAGRVTMDAFKGAAVAGAAGAAAGAVGAFAAGFAAMGAAAAAGFATVKVGVAGVGDAFKALEAASQSAGADAQAQAKAIASAQKQVEQAMRQVEQANREVEQAIKDVGRAERDVARAKKDSRDAEQDLTRARKDATQQIEDLNIALSDGQLSEAEAVLSLDEANEALAETLANSSATANERRRAILRVESAEQRLIKTQRENKKLAEDVADANEKGIEGSDAVVSAKERVSDAAQAERDAEEKLEDAHQGVADAQRSLADAQRGVIEAQKALTDATNQTSAAQDKAAAALAKLSPNARAFVLAMRDIKPLFTDLRTSVQDNLFAGLDTSIGNLARTSVPTLKAGMGEVATALNGAAQGAASFFSTASAQQGIRDAFSGTAGLITGMGPGLAQATQGFLSLASAAKPAMQGVGAALGGLLGSIGQAFTDAANSGALTQLVTGFGTVLDGLGQGLKPVIDGLIQAANLVAPALGPFLQQIGTSVGALLPILGQLGATFVSTLTPLLPVVQQFAAELLTGLEPIIPVLGQILAALIPALQPLIPHLSQIAQVVGTALAQAITALAPAIGPLGEAFASLVTAVAPLLPAVAEIVGGLVSALAPALTTVFEAMAPVIQQMATLMMPVFRELQPVLADVAMKLGQALADSLSAIAPVLPDIAQSFSNLMLAIAPILPQLAQMIAELLPPLVQIFVELTPVLLKVIDGFTWLVNNVIVPLLIPWIQKLTDQFRKVLDDTKTYIVGAKDLVGNAIEGMGKFFSGLGETVGNVWNGIVRAIARGVKAVGELLKQVKIPDWVPGIGGKGADGLGSSLVAWADAHMAGGGLFRGRGTRTSDSNLVALSDHEFVTNAKATEKNLPLLKMINAGWVPSPEFLRLMVGEVPGFAGGGIVQTTDTVNQQQQAMWDVLRNAWPNAVLTSATRTVDVGSGFDHHMGGKAIDIAGPDMVGMAAWIAERFPGSLELIHSNGFGHNIKNGQDVGDGFAFYGAGTMAGHADHVHWAMPGAPSMDGLGEPGSGAGASAGGGAFTSPGSGFADLGGGGGGATTSGGGAGGGTSSGATSTPGATPTGQGAPVWVTNWPNGFGAGSPSAATGFATSPDSGPPMTPGASPSIGEKYGVTPQGGQGAQGGPADKWAEWAQGVGNQWKGFAEEHWREMLNTGLAVVGMGAVGGARPINIDARGSDPRQIARVIERNENRKTLAAQVSGGFGRGR